MKKSHENPLPRRVRKVDIGEAVFAVANDKLVFAAKGAREHITVHLGPHSKILDVHRTSIASDGSVTHTCLYAIAHENVAKVWQDLALLLWTTLKDIVRPLSIDWMQRERVGAIVGLLPVEDDLSNVTTIRRGKLAVDPKKLLAQAWVPEFLDELVDVEGQIFTLFSCRDPRKPRRIGHGFALKDRFGRRRLVWVSEQRAADTIRHFQRLLRMAAAKHRAVRQEKLAEAQNLGIAAQHPHASDQPQWASPPSAGG